MSKPARSLELASEPGDSDARRTALDPSRSFIVQAPAGSGKTELLIQRYLALLSLANEPEEIAAITFTRKAAAEMKNRVLAALEEARVAGPEQDAAELPPHERLTRRHALGALARERQRGWDLAHSASRLRIQTIDALCASLTRQMPVLSEFGAQPESIDDAQPLFREAARATLELLDAEDDSGNDVALLLEHLDNNLDAAADLITAMLARRDHWLRNLARGDDRESLEAGLRAVRQASRARLASLLPGDTRAELVTLLNYAAANLEAMQKSSPLRACADLQGLPDAGETAHAAWLGLCEMLLTREGEWRKPGGLNVTIGFPAGEDKAGKALAKQWKERLAALIERLGEIPALQPALHALRSLPAAKYQERQWQVLGAILRLMPLAVAQLRLVFARRGQADFVEIAQRALLCLGTSDAPTDLMLALDYRIHHLLVDEFQDTSLTQFQLLEKLTAGWPAEDEEGRGSERTLFLVGDPMQSIYRFREADVGLFLKAWREGLGGIPLEPLTLSANFRSQAGIVDWVNAAFSQILPPHNDIATGAVRYTLSQAVHEAQPGAVGLHAQVDASAEEEAGRVAEIARQALQGGAGVSVAVLVRNRGHLRAILPALRDAGLSFRAIEIEALGHRQAVQDMYALTRALAHREDRVAWLALLRAPWCGLSLADLHALAGVDVAALPGDTEIQQDLFGGVAEKPVSMKESHSKKGMSVWELAHHAEVCARLSTQGQVRLRRLRDALQQAMDNPLRGNLRARVECAWLALGGPACVEDETDLADIDIYLDCLGEHESAGELADAQAFEQAVSRLYALPDLSADERLQIMTIHKAKGLEFDTVIVPALGAGSGRDERGLFAWMEIAAPDDAASEAQTQLLMAPINASGSDSEPIYEYLRRLDHVRGMHENARLLYVAATRARGHLHLLGAIGRDASGGLRAPAAGSLLERLWPVAEGEFARQALHAVAVPNSPVSASADEQRAVRHVRLAEGWQLPPLPPPVSWTVREGAASAMPAVEFSWAGEIARHVGSVVHRWLQRMAEDQLQGWDAARIDALQRAFTNELATRGVDEAQCEGAVERVKAALLQTLDDPRGRWLLGAQRDGRSEYRLGTCVEGERQEWIIDRTFVDEQGRRWIVDYKTSSHEGADAEGFMDREKSRYAAQLERYAQLLGGGAVCLGLYFPLLRGWREWESANGR